MNHVHNDQTGKMSAAAISKLRFRKRILAADVQPLPDVVVHLMKYRQN